MAVAKDNNRALKAVVETLKASLLALDEKVRALEESQSSGVYSRNHRALVDAQKVVRKNQDDLLNRMKDMQSAYTTMQTEMSQIRSQVNALFAMRGTGPTS